MGIPKDDQLDVGLAIAQASQFETFFRSSYSSLVSVLSVGADDVEDAVQEAFLEAHLNWARVSHYDNPAAWVRLVAVRRLLNRDRGRLRRSRAVRRLPVREMPDRTLLALDVPTRVRQLPPRQRMAVALFYFWDFSEEEVAEAMGVSLGTVKATLHSARKSLRLQLETDDVNE